MAVTLVVRGPGSIRSPSEHVDAITAEIGRCRVILYGLVPAPESKWESVRDKYALSRLLEPAPEESVLIYGGETLLPVIQQFETETVWLALGPGVNAIRELWRLRGTHGWIAKRRLALLLEDGRMESQLRRSALSAVGRLTSVVVMPPASEDHEEVTETMADVAAGGQPEPEEPAPELTESMEGLSEPSTEATVVAIEEAELVQPAETGGGTELLANQTGAPASGRDQETEKALLARYALVLEKRNLQMRLEQVEELLGALLKETFGLRFQVNAETAAAFEDLTRKLADSAAEFKRLTRQREQVEQQLTQLSWLKTELGL